MAGRRMNKRQQQRPGVSQPPASYLSGSADVLAFLVLLMFGIPALVIVAAYFRQILSSAFS